MMRKIKFSLILVATALSVSSASYARQINQADINVPDGYRIEAAIKDLAAPTMVAFDNQNRMLIAESGYNDGGAKITRIEKDGGKRTLLTGDKLGGELPITSVAYHQGKVYVVHGGSVSTLDEDGTLSSVLTGIPHGDHQANQLVFKDGSAYLSVGTVTNSGVVGPDNAVFGWLKDPANRDIHDVPCVDYDLTDQTFESENVIGNSGEKVRTGPFSAFATTSDSVKGDVKCNGSVLKFKPDGSSLQVYASGLRNPYGLEIGPDRQLYVTMHGFDARGSRPIENAWDCLYKVEEGAWYGWPDYACDVAVTDVRFKVKDKPAPQFIIKNHPSDAVPKPIAKFNPHAATNGFAFAANSGWGKTTDAYITLFGDFTPATGTVEKPQGVKVVRVDTTSGEISDFITNKVSGQASRNGAGGLEHPSDVTFGPDGSMYITDWGIARVSADGLQLEEDSGVVWKVTKSPEENSASVLSSPSWLIKIPILLILAGLAYYFGRGPRKGKAFRATAVDGLIAGIVTAIAAVLIAMLALQLPWHVPPRVFATIPMGESALASVLEFKIVPVIVGSITLLLLAVVLAFIFNMIGKSTRVTRILICSVLFGLAVWWLLQYFIFPSVFPLVTEKGFPPIWYAVTFTVLCISLGLLRLNKEENEQNDKSNI